MPSVIVSVSEANVSVVETYANVIVNLDDGSNVNVTTTSANVSVTAPVSNVQISTAAQTITAGTGVTIVGDVISIGQDVATSANVSFGNVTSNFYGSVGNIATVNATTINATTINANIVGNITGNINGNLSGNVTGSLTGNVTGTTVTLTGNANAAIFNGTTANLTGNVNATNFNGNLVGNVTGTLTGNVTGNVSGNANNASFLGGVAASGYLQTTGTGSGLTAINGANITGNVTSANVAQYVNVETGSPTTLMLGAPATGGVYAHAYLAPTSTTLQYNGAGELRILGLDLLNSTNLVATSNLFASTANFDVMIANTAIASGVTLTATNSTNADHYMMFGNAATGNVAVRTDIGLTYNPSTHVITLGNVGNVGRIDNATISNANAANVTSNVRVTFNTDSGNTYFVPFVFANSSVTGLSVNANDGLRYRPNTQTLYVGNLVATGSVSGSDLYASYVEIIPTDTGTNQHWIYFGNTNSGTDRVRTDSTLNYFPTANLLRATNLTATGNSNASIFNGTTGNITTVNSTTLSASGNANAAIFNGTTGNIATVNATTLNGNIDFGTF